MERPDTPSEFGPEWDRMVNLITEHVYAPRPRLILGPAKWARVLQAASPEDRAVLEAMEADRTIIVSPHLPDPEVAYRYEPKAGHEYKSPVTWDAPPEDRMTDAIRRAAGGPGSGRA